MKRRLLLTTTLLLPFGLTACGNSVNVDAKGLVDAVAGALVRFAPPDLGAKLTALTAQLSSGNGDWKATVKAVIDVANAVLDTNLVPEPYASLTRTTLAGLGLLIGLAGATLGGVTLEQARDAAVQLRALR